MAREKDSQPSVVSEASAIWRKQYAEQARNRQWAAEYDKKQEREKNRKEELEWAKKWWRPPPPNPVFKIHKEDNVFKRLLKNEVNKEIYDLQILFRERKRKKEDEAEASKSREMNGRSPEKARSYGRER